MGRRQKPEGTLKVESPVAEWPGSPQVPLPSPSAPSSISLPFLFTRFRLTNRLFLAWWSLPRSPSIDYVSFEP